MNKFTRGVITGGIIGGLGVGFSMLISDPSTRRKVVKQSKNFSRKAENMLEL